MTDNTPRISAPAHTRKEASALPPVAPVRRRPGNSSEGGKGNA
jgi:hypothetical protein